jgi:uncharacterized protein (TIGR02594 family)
MQNYIVTADWLRLRAGPGTLHKTLGYLAKNSIVQGEGDTNHWMHIINSNGQTGWSSTKHLKEIDVASPQAPDTAIGNFTVNIGALNIRQGPGRNYAIIGSVLRGDVVEGFSQSLDGQWTQIKNAKGILGWSSTKYLSRSVAATPPPGAEREMIVTSELLNIRSNPGPNYSVLGALKRGDVVTVVNVSQDWEWMQISGQTGGWCAGKYLIERDMLSISAEDLSALGKHRVATYVLALREKPGPDERQLGTLNFGQVVEVDQISEDKLWKHCTTALGQTGWCSFQFLASLEDLADAKDHEEFPWVNVAFDELGTREIPGDRSNPRILEYLASTSLFKFPYLPDETNWCAAFVNWCVEKTGVESANSALVFPWTRWGDPLKTPRRGCLVAFQWEDGSQHIAIYLGEVSNYVVALGGNQNDAVWINVYHKRHVIGYRVPDNWPEESQVTLESISS